MKRRSAAPVILPRGNQQDVSGHRRNVYEESFRCAFDVEESRTALVGPYRPFAGQQLTQAIDGLRRVAAEIDDPRLVHCSRYHGVLYLPYMSLKPNYARASGKVPDDVGLVSFFF